MYAEYLDHFLHPDVPPYVREAIRGELNRLVFVPPARHSVALVGVNVTPQYVLSGPPLYRPLDSWWEVKLEWAFKLPDDAKGPREQVFDTEIVIEFKVAAQGN